MGLFCTWYKLIQVRLFTESSNVAAAAVQQSKKVQKYGRLMLWGPIIGATLWKKVQMAIYGAALMVISL